MTHDRTIYNNPDEFNPDRYLAEDDGGLAEPFPIGQFGYGRRVCVGKHLAEASLWIVVATMLSVMKIEKARDENGNEIVPKVELTNGLTSHPKPYQCRITPRDEGSAHVIRGSMM
jgi:cytochrome P450